MDVYDLMYDQKSFCIYYAAQQFKRLKKVKWLRAINTIKSCHKKTEHAFYLNKYKNLTMTITITKFCIGGVNGIGAHTNVQVHVQIKTMKSILVRSEWIISAEQTKTLFSCSPILSYTVNCLQ